LEWAESFFRPVALLVVAAGCIQLLYPASSSCGDRSALSWLRAAHSCSSCAATASSIYSLRDLSSCFFAAEQLRAARSYYKLGAVVDTIPQLLSNRVTCMGMEIVDIMLLLPAFESKFLVVCSNRFPATDVV
jgi:hypothetical protein